MTYHKVDELTSEDPPLCLRGFISDWIWDSSPKDVSELLIYEGYGADG